jgi:hypothetical protein
MLILIAAVVLSGWQTSVNALSTFLFLFKIDDHLKNEFTLNMFVSG